MEVRKAKTNETMLLDACGMIALLYDHMIILRNKADACYFLSDIKILSHIPV